MAPCEELYKDVWKKMKLLKDGVSFLHSIYFVLPLCALSFDQYGNFQPGTLASSKLMPMQIFFMFCIVSHVPLGPPTLLFPLRL
jgi:hypothetical protein